MLSCHKLGRKPSPTRNEKPIIFKSEVRNITKCSQAKQIQQYTITSSDLRQFSSKASKFSRIFQVLHDFLKFLFSIVTTFHIFKCFEILQEEKEFT